MISPGYLQLWLARKRWAWGKKTYKPRAETRVAGQGAPFRDQQCALVPLFLSSVMAL